MLILSVVIRVAAFFFLLRMFFDWQEGGSYVFTREFYLGTPTALCFYIPMILLYMGMLFIPLLKLAMFTANGVFAIFLGVAFSASLFDEWFAAFQNKKFPWFLAIDSVLMIFPLIILFWLAIVFRKTKIYKEMKDTKP